MRLIVATSNDGKLTEIKELFKEKNLEVVGLKDIGWTNEIDENGTTFEENAMIKAKAIGDAYPDDFVLADDTGLSIDALDGRPGVHTARYAGDHDDEANMAKVLEELFMHDNRGAHFETVAVLRKPTGEFVVSSGRVEGSIAEQKTGDDGHGYDPIFLSNELGKTFGQSTIDEKNTVSHRSRALAEILRQF
jgi:XTP/dITP diphosphohydrolase